MEPSPIAKEHFAKQHMEQAARTVAAVEEARAKEVEENQRAYERFYNNLALFSGGTVALSVTYLGYLKTLTVPVVHKGWLVDSWSAFFTCLLCSVFWLLFHTHYSHYFRDRDYCEAVKKQYETEIAAARVNDFETVLTKFSEFFIFVPIPGFSQKNFAPGTPESDDSRPDRPTASPLLSLLKRISLFQSRSPLAADRLLENLGLLICAVMSSLLYHRPPPTGSGSGVETGLLIQTWLGRAGGLGALPTKRSG